MGAGIRRATDYMYVMQNIHSFSLGDRVNLAKAPPKTPRGPYTITALMPEGPDGEPQYGIKAEGEGPERVVTESDILSVSPATPEELRAQREAEKAERQAEARTAWNDYIEERESIARRTAELREMRLKAEAAAAAKIAALAKSAQATKAAASKTGTAKKAGSVKAEAKPAAKTASAAKAKVPAAAKKAPLAASPTKTAAKAETAKTETAKAEPAARKSSAKTTAARAIKAPPSAKAAAKTSTQGKAVKSAAPHRQAS